MAQRLPVPFFCTLNRHNPDSHVRSAPYLDRYLHRGIRSTSWLNQVSLPPTTNLFKSRKQYRRTSCQLTRFTQISTFHMITFAFPLWRCHFQNRIVILSVSNLHFNSHYPLPCCEGFSIRVCHKEEERKKVAEEIYLCLRTWQSPRSDSRARRFMTLKLCVSSLFQLSSR